MKDLDAVTKVAPTRRRDEIRLFMEELQRNDVTREILAGWGLRLNKDLSKFNGRCLPPETIYFGNSRSYTSQDRPTDWTSGATRNPVLRTVSAMKCRPRLR